MALVCIVCGHNCFTILSIIPRRLRGVTTTMSSLTPSIDTCMMHIYTYINICLNLVLIKMEDHLHVESCLVKMIIMMTNTQLQKACNNQLFIATTMWSDCSVS